MEMARRFFSFCKVTAPDTELQILAFPVLVVLLASFSFLLGGCCTPWQWWLSVVGVLAWPWIAKRGVPKALAADLMFLAILVILWCLVPLTLDAVRNPDSGNYHLPTIRLLARGWNPVRDPEAMAILRQLGLERDGMTYFSVAFLPKTAGIFDACASWFCNDPMSVTLPLKFFLFVGVIVAAVRAFPKPWPCGILVAMVLANFAPPESHVDNCLALASGGLLLTMLENIQARRLRFLPLFAFTFWMLTLKLPGCVAAFGFWIIFSGVFLVENKKQTKTVIPRLALMVALLTVVAGLASFNPYGTSLRDHGHPLYPLQSVDPERHPIRNIAGDCKVGNDDWKKMGYFGRLFNSYTLPSVVRAYYNRKLARNDFAPHQYVWDMSFNDTGKMSPLSKQRRFRIWIPLLILLVLPGRRFLGGMMVFGLMALPGEYMGIERYYPWIPAFKAVALGSTIGWLAERKLPWAKRIVCAGSAVILVWFSVCSGRTMVGMFRAKVRELKTPRNVVFACLRRGPVIPLDYPMEGKPRYPEGRTQRNNVILLFDSLGRNDVIVDTRPPGQIDGLDRTQFGYYVESISTENSPEQKPGQMPGRLWRVESTVRDYVAMLWNRF